MSADLPLKSMVKTRFVGALVGGAIGDALGFPHEGRSRSFMFALGDEATDRYEAHRSGYHGPGQYSIETQFALLTVESLVKEGRFDPSMIAARLTDLYRDNGAVGRDVESIPAFERLAAGATWDRSGSQSARGGGALSRAVPIGLWYHDRLDRCAEAAAESARITHSSSVPMAACAAVATAAAYCVTHREVILGEFIDDLVAATRPIDTEVADGIANLPHVLASPEPAVIHELLAIGRDENIVAEGLASDARAALLCALYYFLRSPSRFDRCVQGCLLVGGDVDGPAFLAGALSGAFNGEEGLRSDLRDELFEVERITRLAEELYVARIGTHD
ncbi:MAG: ADP-ribosylglycohydrolase family protein [Planctomycetes bacterium]|nr:ADP-ribosylglycohydrolase family protein [Planctomycetota bacterium]